MKSLLSFIHQHKQGLNTGVYSVCSAHPLVLEAAFKQAAKDKRPVLIEATSNQVNQFGGYTGMTPKAFAKEIFRLADKLSFPHEDVILGGDHLGPNCWQNLSAKEAMICSEKLIHDYVAAGFRKIHLDCSMACSGDPVPLDEKTMADRAARLCLIAEHTWKQHGGEPPVYVIGTEVPVPGGAQESLEQGVEVTSAVKAHATLESHKASFNNYNLDYVWSRVIGLVVQPGVEFDHHSIYHYDSKLATGLKEVLNTQPDMVFEAHSTDYQKPEAYHQLVRDHFAILKVGPALTFALREALFALDRIEVEWLGSHQASHLREVVSQVMQERPEYWRSHYASKGHQQYLDCRYSLSDRIRYYWNQSEVEAALQSLFGNLEASPAPVTLISQYLPNQAKAITNNHISNSPAEIVIHKIMEVTEVYSEACFANSATNQEYV